MTNQNQAHYSTNRAQPKRRPKLKTMATLAEQTDEQIKLGQRPAEHASTAAADHQATLSQLLHGPNGVFGGGSVQNQAARLSDPRLQSMQRQALTSQIGRVQGNRHLQRMIGTLETTTNQVKPGGHQPVSSWTGPRSIQRDPNDSSQNNNFQLTPPTLSLPKYKGPSLGGGQLKLDLTPFQGLSIENSFSPSLLFQPSPELLQQLVDNWIWQYRLLHPGPPLHEDAWQQLWSAWRRLTDQWIARGADAPLNAELAQDLLRDQAAQTVLNQQQGSTASLDQIAGKVWPAFKKSLEATQFYPKLKKNAEELAGQHWPVLIPVIGTALGTSLGMGLTDNDWRGMEQLSGLLPMVNKDIRLGGNWTMSLGFSDSQPIKGIKEQGVVIGLNPTLGFKYKKDDIQFSLESSVNLRLETGQNSDQGFQVHTSPGAKMVLQW